MLCDQRGAVPGACHEACTQIGGAWLADPPRTCLKHHAQRECQEVRKGRSHLFRAPLWRQGGELDPPRQKLLEGCGARVREFSPNCLRLHLRWPFQFFDYPVA